MFATEKTLTFEEFEKNYKTEIDPRLVGVQSGIFADPNHMLTNEIKYGPDYDKLKEEDRIKRDGFRN